MIVECSQCGEIFKRIGCHWSQSSKCDYPKLTDEQKEITTGLLMADGCVNYTSDKNPCLVSGMISPNYLEYIDEKFGVFGMGVSLKVKAEENAERNQNNGFSPNAEAKNYSDIYWWRSRRHPEFQEFADWYSTGKKVWPEDIELTPTVLKHWYCGDGHWDNSGSHSYIEISMANEINNTGKVDEMFETVGLPSPSNYAVSERVGGGRRCKAKFTVEQSKELWEYMGEPLPDFEYKWPEEYKS